MHGVDLFIWVAKQWYGKWYCWAGDDPAGVDCSGLVVECLRSVGLLGRNVDLSADGLWHKFRDRKTEHKRHWRGCLVFWFDGKGKAIHTGICMNDTEYMGADGGHRYVRTAKEAKEKNAYVKIRPIVSRGEPVEFCDPFGEPVNDARE